MRIGPYISGEIPPPLVYTFLDNEGNPIDLSNGYVAKFAHQVRGEEAELLEAEVTDAEAGQVTYTWTATDLATVQVHSGMFWAGNGTNRLASEQIDWSVGASVGEPPDI